MDSTKLSALTEKAARMLLSFAGLVYIVLVIYIVLSRINYKFELEWLEGDSLVEVGRIISGLGLYVRPSVEFVSLIYPPIYFYVSALFARLLGLGFTPLRLVSFLSSLACGAFLVFAIREKTSRWSAALLSAGCFASLFMISGQWYDIARVDMLAVAFAFAAVILVRERAGGRNPWIDFGSGVLFALAFLTKQHALIIFLAIATYYLVFNRRVLLSLGLGFGLATLLLFGLFEIGSQGWMTYYLFQVPAGHTFDVQIGSVISALISEFLPIPVFLILAFLPLLVSFRKVWNDKSLRYYFAAAVGLILMGTIGYLNKYATRNVFIPSYLGIALLVGLESGWAIEHAQSFPRLTLARLLLTVEWLVLIGQFGSQFNAFISTRTIPTSKDLAAGNAMVERIREMAGDVLIPRFGYLDLLAGKKVFYGEIAMSEFRGQGNQYPLPEWKDLHAQIFQTIHAPNTSAIILDYYAYMQPDLIGCKKQQVDYPDAKTFIPVAGANSRPDFIFICH